MKITNSCPKCKGKDILIIPGEIGAYGAGNNIRIGWINTSAVKVNRFLCESCGYSEEWINKEDIPKVKKKYKNQQQKF